MRGPRRVVLRGALVRLAWTVTVGAAYAWPLDQPAAPTSTFGEYRSRHFHGGLDLSTQETVGLPVRALDACEAVRVRASGVGYGRGLYLRLADGRTAVYGHLDGFAPDLARWLAGVQDSTGQYEQDLVPPAGRFRYRRGDLVAYAGDSGAGPAHLHLEIREADTGVNPFSVGFSVPDHVAPTLTGLWVYPASAAARVDGGTTAVRVPLKRGRDGVARSARALRVSGPVKVAVEGFDRTEAKPNRLALYSVAAALDGAAVFEARFDSVSWLDAAEAEMVFDPRARSRGAADAYSLTPPAELRCLALKRAAPAWERAPGAHALAVTAADPAGNSARAEATLEWVEPGREVTQPIPAGRRSGGGLEVDLFPDGMALRGGGSGGAPSANLAPVGESVGRGTRERTFGLAEDFLGPVEARSGAAGPARRLLVAMARPGWSRELRSDDGAFTLALESGSLFAPYPLAVETRAPAGGAGAGPRPPAARYRVEPTWLPLRQPVGVRLRLPQGESAAGLALFCSGRDGTRFVGGPDASLAGVLSGSTRALGEFFVLRDTVAPLVGAARVRAGGRSPGPGGRGAPLEVRWRAGDGGVGVDAAACVLEVDGRREAVEYDPETGAFRWRPDERPGGRLPAGRHAYRLTAADRLGNRRTYGGSFRLP
jgi:hypothetical protein